MRKVYSVIAVICIFMLFTAPVAFGQDLDGIWFKVTYTAKGNIEGANEAIGQKQQAKVVNYIQLVYNDVWSTQCPGDFSRSMRFTRGTLMVMCGIMTMEP